MVLPFNPETVEFTCTPQSFLGMDALFSILSALTALLISFYSYEVYRLNKKTNYKWFSLSLLLISLSFIAQIATSYLLYNPQAIQMFFINFGVLYNIATGSNIIHILGLLASRFLMLGGFFGIYWLISKSKEKNKLPFIGFLLFTTTVLSAYSYIVFHITMILLLSHVVYYYNINYNSSRNSKTLMILLSFILLFVSQIVFILLFLDTSMYAAASVIQLGGYMLLLYSYYLIVKGK